MMINNSYLIYEVRAQTLGGETLPPESWILPTAAAQKDQVTYSEVSYVFLIAKIVG